MDNATEVGVRSFPRELSPYLHIARTHRPAVLALSDSDMIREYRAYRERHYPHRRDDGSDLRHYVVEGHDFYHEILACGFAETAIAAADITDERLRRLLEEA